MENEILTKEEKYLLFFALNDFFYSTHRELEKKDLGTIERRQLESFKMDSEILLSKLIKLHWD